MGAGLMQSGLEVSVWLSLGSNLGDRSLMLAQARQALDALPHFAIKRISRELPNPPLLEPCQGEFLNQIVVGASRAAAPALLQQIKDLERQLGRKKRARYGPREIDIDILVFGDHCQNHPELCLPHPGLVDRPYLHQLCAQMGLDWKAVLADARRRGWSVPEAAVRTDRSTMAGVLQ
ncbi:MAG: 2-amino-4-hydroxy-6-hydroxymethyldihydropteridine diphosphokinase [Leptospiraceae bacterium]|nr:2-amino-4-hydroxy-6-hydroxymethyldihydropteridine diphosphokinase [Leptospiraceae bacterium]